MGCHVQYAFVLKREKYVYQTNTTMLQYGAVTDLLFAQLQAGVWISACRLLVLSLLLSLRLDITFAKLAGACWQ